MRTALLGLRGQPGGGAQPWSPEASTGMRVSSIPRTSGWLPAVTPHTGRKTLASGTGSPRRSSPPWSSDSGPRHRRVGV